MVKEIRIRRVDDAIKAKKKEAPQEVEDAGGTPALPTQSSQPTLSQRDKSQHLAVEPQRHPDRRGNKSHLLQKEKEMQLLPAISAAELWHHQKET